ncbi:MAG: hypothetical protein J0H09_21905 [Burkholderiales bacterium]|nr:hypothetical protein [Burkholderiales bacterium]
MDQIFKDISFIALVVAALAGFLYGCRRLMNWLDARRRADERRHHVPRG